MAAKELEYCWEWHLRASPEVLWPLVADTNRFNFETGAPAVSRLPSNGSASPGGRRRLRLELGRGIEFEEEPFEWVRPERFGVVRRYRSGPLAQLRALLELHPDDGGSRLGYRVWARPRGVAGRVVVPLTIGQIARRRMDEAFRRYDTLLAGGTVQPAARARARLAPGGRERLTASQAELERQGASSELVGRLTAEISSIDDVAAARLRPYALADVWGADRRETLELCLLATRAGLLESRWEVICPLCRGAAASVDALSGIDSQVHCDSCQIDVNADFERSIELTFRPSPSIREVEVHDFCVGGPGVTPHIVAQQLLAPGEHRDVSLALEPGSYRMRTLGLEGSSAFVVGPGEARSAVAFVNDTAEERLIVAERTAWNDQAATAADVTALQAFRDLFATEALRPGENMAVGSLTILFTDLRDSTRLYREIGDAPAYGSVVSHFDVLRSAVADEGGAIVKTIGDAVMAVFRRPVSSLRAVLRAQRELATPSTGARSLFLKAGIHLGPCIAVTLNGRLDYFGSTVNAAARIVGLSDGQDIVVSGAVKADPEVTRFLGGYDVAHLDTTLKGFDDERFELWRVSARG